ncbi:FG-GAP-like repeat-containing protein [Jiangella asiatica]|uniref:Pectate lyase superfamily protein domain-containing protein n=1 Tax=Jiangella asiatica TaxID=2530372 RepID=A0A4R5DNW1_9ACTN|nr:FG-GAP-like repeat-containing protein [Jiangella asiatica]TDE15909.1 hypothetical protein E1269_01040 [Jiangella asiatica]
MRRAVLMVLATVLAAAFLIGWTNEPSRPEAKDQRRPEPKVVDVGDHRGDGRSDTDAIQAAIDAARPGQTVTFPPGIYELDRPIRLASRVDYVATPGGPVVLRSAEPGGLTIAADADRPLRDVTIGGLTFDNLRIALEGDDKYSSIVDVTLRDCVFRNGRPSRDWGVPYVTLRRTSGVTIDGCQFLRGPQNPGRGVVADMTRLTVVKDSFFGTTPNLEADVPNGYFRTAVNVWGHDLDTGIGNDEVVIDGNVWRRTPGIGAPKGCLFCQDHGLYAWGSRRLAVVGNYADGWDATPLGGTMKLRNQHDTVVAGNNLRSSGIYAYVYASEVMPEVFQRVSIRDNAIDMGGSTDCRHYCGVTYWRDASIPGAQGIPEQDVFIGGNAFVDGGSISVSTAYGPAFCVQGNGQVSLTAHLGPVRTSACGAAPAWEDPFAGVHRGDFDGDGDEDFAHLVREEGEDPYWRVNLDTGSGVRIEEWQARLGGADDDAASPVAARFGVHVGDFDGDGRDDLAFVGLHTDGTPRWLVSRSTGDGLAEPRDWAILGTMTPETTSFGYHVGDFDGDGRDDLLARGSCSNDNTCWRLLASDGESFEARSAGDDTAWSADSARFGLAIGDYDGDGTDDVAYRGVCGNDATPCFRVHLGGPSGLTVRSFGDEAWPAPDGTTAHFGLRVGDVDADGNDDISYLGRCGNNSDLMWRHHLSTGDSFAVRCSRYATSL